MFSGASFWGPFCTCQREARCSSSILRPESSRLWIARKQQTERQPYKQVPARLSSTFGEGVAINDLTLLPQASLRFDAHTDAHTHAHTRKMRRGYKPPTLFNYAVKFYPNALVMPWSREAAASLGTHDAPWSGRRRKEDVPGGTGGRPRHRPHGGDQFQTLFSFSAFCYPSNQRKRKLRWLRPCFQMQLFLGTQ